NADGKPDLIVTDQGSGKVSVLINTTANGASTPTFAFLKAFTTGTAPQAVATADLNGDNKPDIVAANSGSNTVSVLLNTTPTGSSTPTFAAKQDFAVGTFPYGVALVDINGDG